MTTIKSIIVDDELEAREGIKQLLETDPDIEILGLCKNGVEAIDMINEHEVDLVFLDIQMPIVSGFEVVNSISEDRLPHIVFITAYDQFAVRAFEVHAVDYILKPFTNARFTEGLMRAKHLINQNKTFNQQEKLKQIAGQLSQKEYAEKILVSQTDFAEPLSRLIVKDKGQIKFIFIGICR